MLMPSLYSEIFKLSCQNFKICLTQKLRSDPKQKGDKYALSAMVGGIRNLSQIYAKGMLISVLDLYRKVITLSLLSLQIPSQLITVLVATAITKGCPKPAIFHTIYVLLCHLFQQPGCPLLNL